MKCEVCEEEPFKYKCPKCLKKSCSLECVNKHKTDAKCDGVRDKTKFVKVSEFTDIDLLNDYRFLEDGGRLSDGATRDQLKKQRDKPSYLAKFISQCKKRGTILKLLPFKFSRRKQNSSQYNFKSKTILWHLEWNFKDSEAVYSDRRVSEETALKDILIKYVHPTDSDPIRRQKLKIYVEAGLANIKLFMKIEGRKANSTGYYELDLEKKIVDNLKDKIVIEFPTIHVVLKDKWHLFKTGDEETSDESEESSSSGEESSESEAENVTSKNPSESRKRPASEEQVNSEEKVPKLEVVKTDIKLENNLEIDNSMKREVLKLEVVNVDIKLGKNVEVGNSIKKEPAEKPDPDQ